MPVRLNNQTIRSSVGNSTYSLYPYFLYQYVCYKRTVGDYRNWSRTPGGGGYFGVKRIGMTVGNRRKLP